MQSLGNLLERLGPAFGVLFMALTITVGVVLITMSAWRLVHRDKPQFRGT